MLFIKRIEKICFSFLYMLFIGLLLLAGMKILRCNNKRNNWILGKRVKVSISSGLTGGSILENQKKIKRKLWNEK